MRVGSISISNTLKSMRNFNNQITTYRSLKNFLTFVQIFDMFIINEQ